MKTNKNNLLRNIMIEESFLSNDICEFLINYIKTNKEIDLGVFDAEQSNKTKETSWKQDKNIRNTQTVDTKPIQELLYIIIQTAVNKHINPFYNIKIRDGEACQLLIYGPGGHYKPHIDAEAIFNNIDGLEWRDTVKRHVSVIIYLNDKKDYTGGNLIFPDLNIQIEPKKGMLVAFPSTHEYIHGVEPLTTGKRFAIVTWLCI